jgi:septal ring factor EnvC (AmiA/AmiB activator)
MSEPVLIAIVSAIFGGFLGNFLSFRLKKRTDYMDIVNTVLERSDLDLKHWGERITKLEMELDLKKQENCTLENKIAELQRSNREKDITIARLSARVNQLEAELALLKGSAQNE